MSEMTLPLTVELRLLVYSVALLIACVAIQASAGLFAQGLPAMAGSRDNLPAPKTFQARTKRLVDNHREGLAMFAPLVLVAALMNLSNEWTVLAARLFFYSRLAHAIVYLLGVAWIRAGLWGIGMVGTLMMLLSLLGIIS